MRRNILKSFGDNDLDNLLSNFNKIFVTIDLY